MITAIRTLNNVRRDHRTYDLEPDWRLVESNTLAFTKGDSILVLISNDQQETGMRVITVKNHPFKIGDKLCNAFSATWDCVDVDS